jgi:hypothetical protein
MSHPLRFALLRGTGRAGRLPVTHISALFTNLDNYFLLLIYRDLAGSRRPFGGDCFT